MEIILLLNVASSLSPFKHNILYYISGYICRKIQSSITCSSCALAIFQSLPTSLEDHSYYLLDAGCKFTARKNNGGLLFASNGVYEIVKRCEKLFIINLLNSQSKISSEQGICKKLIIACMIVLSSRFDCLFPNLKSDCLEVAKRYLTMRLQTYAKFFNRLVINGNKASVRHKMTKTILFKNQ